MRRPFSRPIAVILVIASLGALAACAGGGEAVEVDESYRAERLVIRDFIGTLTIVTTDPGGEIEMHVAAQRSQLDLLPIELAGDELVVTWEGVPDRTRRWWEFWRGRWMVDLAALDRYPTLEIAVPSDIEIEIENIIGEWTIGDRAAHLALGADRGHGVVGSTETAAISVSGDAEVEIGPVAGRLDLAIAGSGTVNGAGAATLELAVTGSGDVTLGNIVGAAAINITGSGSAQLGDAASLEAALSGSGSLRLGAIADGFDASVLGSGSIVAAAVSGAFQAAVSGSGSIRIDAGRASPFEVTIAGSGSVRYGGTAVDPVAAISGSGRLVLGAIEGNLDARTAGAGGVDVLN